MREVRGSEDAMGRHAYGVGLQGREWREWGGRAAVEPAAALWVRQPLHRARHACPPRGGRRFIDHWASALRLASDVV